MKKNIILQLNEEYGDKLWFMIEYENVSIEKDWHDKMECNADLTRGKYKQEKHFERGLYYGKKES